jgi:flagellin
MSLSIQTSGAAQSTAFDLVNAANGPAAPDGSTAIGASGGTADDATTLSDRLAAQLDGIDQAQTNAQDALGLVQTGGGALAEVHAMLHRVRDLLESQARSGTPLSSTEAASISSELTQISAEIGAIASQTSFNGIDLLSGSATITFQIGSDGETVGVSGLQLFGSGAGYQVDSSIFGAPGSDVSLASVDAAIANVSGALGELGAVQSRLEGVLHGLDTMAENLGASSSSPGDVELALSLTQSTSSQVVGQGGTAVAAQANTNPGSVLSLLL